MHKLFALLGRPRPIKNHILNRKVSWLELFYDLMFAVVIARLTEAVVEEPSAHALVNATLLFAWFIWGWNEASGYFDTHGNDSIITILIINTSMVITGVGTLFIPEAVAGNFSHITFAFMALEALMAAVWYGLSFFDPVHGPASRVWAGVHLSALALLMITTLFGPVIRFWGLTVGMLLNIGTVFFANPRLSREYEETTMVHELSDSLVERYGLMTMIALGEVIAGLYDPLKGTHVSGQVVFETIICLILVAVVAACFYQIIGDLQIVLPSSIGTSLTGWLFLFVILAAYYIGVSLQLVLEDGTDAHWWLTISLILYLLGIHHLALIGTPARQHLFHTNLVIGLDLLALLAVTLLPTTAYLVATILILFVLIVDNRIMTAP